jgi:hypothetical protein
MTDFNDFGFSDDPEEITTTTPTPVASPELENGVLQLASQIAEVSESVEYIKQTILDNQSRTLDAETKLYVAEKLDSMSECILPLLTKLRDSTGDRIYWPADVRRKVIDEQIEKMRVIIDG